MSFDPLSTNRNDRRITNLWIFTSMFPNLEEIDISFMACGEYNRNELNHALLDCHNLQKITCNGSWLCLPLGGIYISGGKLTEMHLDDSALDSLASVQDVVYSFSGE
jgi:hypothetical protein